jgi:4-amino-4-deoxy-L-arabinose transferase-like glycosyltransferase
MRVRAATAHGTLLLAIVVLVSLVTHGYNMFHYPLYLTDEGIYSQQAWAVIHENKLSPYTYFYDHAPGGWLLMALWNVVLPNQTATFGNGINTGRVLMLLLQVATTVMLFYIGRRLTGGYLGAFVAALLFNISPLAIYYQREVLLDNIMVFWLAVCLSLLVLWNNRVITTLAAGLALGIALLTKENAIFFVPVLIYLVHRIVQGRLNRRFAESFWVFASVAPLGGYVTYAVLKNELVPSGLDFNLNTPPAGHVSLLYTVWWQMHRSQAGLFHDMLFQSWLPKDRWLLIGGALAVVVNLFIGWRQRKDNPAALVIPLLAIAYAVYLIRGSVMLEFYILPIIPLLALNVGMLAAHALRSFNNPMKVTVIALSVAILATPMGGYFLVYNDRNQLAVHDLYFQPLTDLQNAQVAYIREHVPPNARIITDDDIWMQLHEAKPFYPYAHSHWKASSDPDVRDRLFQSNWHNIDYVVMSNKMHDAMVGNNAGNQEGWILEAVDQHSQQVWEGHRGDIQLAVYRITGGGASGS